MKLKILQLPILLSIIILFLSSWIYYPDGFKNFTNGFINSDIFSDYPKEDSLRFILDGFGGLFFYSLIFLFIILIFKSFSKNISTKDSNIITSLSISILSINILYSLFFIYSFNKRINEHKQLMIWLTKDHNYMYDGIKVTNTPYLVLFLLICCVIIDFYNIGKSIKK